MEKGFYLSLKNNQHEPTFCYMIQCLLKARIDIGLETETDSGEECVNVYLAHLLESYMNPQFLTNIQQYQSMYDQEIAQKVDSSVDARSKFNIYKINADYYLMLLGIFAGIRNPNKPKTMMNLDDDIYLGRTRNYYQNASIFQERLAHKKTELSGILERLSSHTDRYLKILEKARADYFGIMQTFSRGEWFHLMNEVNQSSDRSAFFLQIDHFLDALNSFKNDPSPEHKERVNTLGSKLYQIIPDYNWIDKE